MPDLPSGFDRADGLYGRLGTPTPVGAVEADRAGATMTVDQVGPEELPDSPTIERGEQATISHEYETSWEDGLTRIVGLGRGLLQVDSGGNLTKMLSASIRHVKGGMCRLGTVSEGLSFDNPPDQFQIMPVELGVNIIKHPRYLYAFLGNSPTEEKLNQMVIRMLQNYFENTSSAYRDALHELIKASLTNLGTVGTPPPPYGETTDPSGSVVGAFVGLLQGTQLAKRAALEILQKYWRNIETPYVVGYQIDWSSFSYLPEYLNPGGYIEDPITEATPQLPSYFWSPVFPPDGRTIFDALAAINPQCYSSNGTPQGAVNISWMRKADTMDYERTWYKTTRTWIGSAVGFWDAELYSAVKRPTVPDDYLPVN